MSQNLDLRVLNSKFKDSNEGSANKKNERATSTPVRGSVARNARNRNPDRRFANAARPQPRANTLLRLSQLPLEPLQRFQESGGGCVG